MKNFSTVNLNTFSKIKFKKRVLIWCSPGFGIIDNWLPIIKKLKDKQDIKIDFIFPEPSSLQLVDKNSDLFNLSERYANEVIYVGNSRRWLMTDTLIHASKSYKNSKIDKKIFNISQRLIAGNISKYIFFKKIGEYLLLMYKMLQIVRENFSHVCLYDTNLMKNVDGILCDITVEQKNVNKLLRTELKHVQKFSILHGCDVLWVKPNCKCKQYAAKKPNVTVYTQSHLELDVYKKCFGILDKNIVHSGIARHDSDWVEYIYNQQFSPNENAFDSFVLIISRPSSTYNTVERKKKALMDIYDVICTKHKLKLIVKTHPKEDIDGIDGDLYKNTLGVENYGKKWMYSHSHPLILGKKALFAISFFSGVAIDMLAIKKPTIEYLNLENLPLYDNENSLRDKYGKPVFQYRYVKLVLGASNKLDLEQHVKSILSNNKDSLLPLYSRYNNYFKPSGIASEIITNDICNKIYN